MHIARRRKKTDPRIPNLDFETCEVALGVLDREAEDILILSVNPLCPAHHEMDVHLARIHLE
jgi:hypothetical protein